MRRWQRNIILALSLISLVITVTACARKDIKNINSKGKNIICFGDSITRGYGANAGEDYPAALSELTDNPVLNMGVEGETTVEALRRIKEDVLDREPLLVVIEFGGNDFLTKVSKENTMRNIKEMVHNIRAAGSMVAIADISAGMFFAEYREEFSRLAKEEGAIFIPAILNGIITNPSMKSDFLHPNGTGYRLIAHQVYRAIRPYLEQNARFKKSS